MARRSEEANPLGLILYAVALLKTGIFAMRGK